VAVRPARRADTVLFLALGLTLAGLVVLFLGLDRGVPLVFFGTAEERAARDSGRTLVLVAAAFLLAPAALLATHGRTAVGVLVAAAGLVTAALMLLYPDAAWAWVAFLLLGGAAAVAALAAALAGRA
jgi:hypothetical protein